MQVRATVHSKSFNFRSTLCRFVVLQFLPNDGTFTIFFVVSTDLLFLEYCGSELGILNN
jgi:hypothetical protein